MSEKITDEANEASPIADDADGLGTREELIRARDSALQSARLRSEFLGNMSHEIRTPLNGIVGMSRLLLDTRLSHEQREMLAIVRQSADTLVKIVTEILDFAKLSAGGVSLEERDFELGAAIESVIALSPSRRGTKVLNWPPMSTPRCRGCCAAIPRDSVRC